MLLIPSGTRKEGNMTMYVPGNSNTTLHAHLDRSHCDMYLKACEQNKWEVKISSARQEQEQTTSTLDANQTPFSKSAFIEHLVRFIATNDQVC